MTIESNRVSNAFEVFMSDAPEFAQAWGGAIQGLAKK